MAVSVALTTPLDPDSGFQCPALYQLGCAVTAAAFVTDAPTVVDIYSYSCLFDREEKLTPRPPVRRSSEQVSVVRQMTPEMNQRVELVRRVCQEQLRDFGWKSPPTDFLLDKKRGIGYCRQAKVSTYSSFTVRID